MILAQRLLAAAIGLAALLLAVGYAEPDLGGGLLSITLGAFLWWVAVWRRRRWAATVGLILATGAAAAGVWLGARPEWMIGGLVSALTAWDLDHWIWTVRSVEQVREGEALERRHLLRVLVADALAIALAVLALRLRIRFSFGAIVLLALLLILALSGVVRSVRREAPRPLP